MKQLGTVALWLFVIAMLALGVARVAPAQLDCVERGGIPAKTWSHPDGTGCLLADR